MSRSWYYAKETAGQLQLTRLRDKGKKRGVTLIQTAQVLALLNSAEEIKD